MTFMNLAIKEARKALLYDEVPVGAVVVKDGKVIAKAHNLRETLNSPSAHAEMIAINMAAKNIKNWRLNGCELYVTLEPCPMCAGAILQSRISRVIIGTFDPTQGAAGSVIDLLQNRNLNYVCDVSWEYNEECSRILSRFFKSKRRM